MSAAVDALLRAIDKTRKSEAGTTVHDAATAMSAPQVACEDTGERHAEQHQET